jgi:hypothetical protein
MNNKSFAYIDNPVYCIKSLKLEFKDNPIREINKRGIKKRFINGIILLNINFMSAVV